MIDLDLDVIRSEIWPDWMRSSQIATLCPCQYGVCGACRQGRHDRCLTTRIGPLYSDTYGYVANARGFVVAGIRWLPDQTPCEYRCPCPAEHPEQPAPRRARRQAAPAAPRPRPIVDVHLPGAAGAGSAAPVQDALFDA